MDPTRREGPLSAVRDRRGLRRSGGCPPLRAVPLAAHRASGRPRPPPPAGRPLRRGPRTARRHRPPARTRGPTVAVAAARAEGCGTRPDRRRRGRAGPRAGRACRRRSFQDHCPSTTKARVRATRSPMTTEYDSSDNERPWFGGYFAHLLTNRAERGRTPGRPVCPGDGGRAVDAEADRGPALRAARQGGARGAAGRERARQCGGVRRYRGKTGTHRVEQDEADDHPQDQEVERVVRVLGVVEEDDERDRDRHEVRDRDPDPPVHARLRPAHRSAVTWRFVRSRPVNQHRPGRPT